MAERQDMDLQSRIVTTSAVRNLPGRHDPLGETESMQVLLAAAGLGEIPASRYQEENQRHASHGSPIVQTIPGSLDRHGTPPVLCVNRQKKLATNDNPTGPRVSYMDSTNTYNTSTPHPRMALEHGPRLSEDATFNSVDDPATMNCVRSNNGQSNSAVEHGRVMSFNSGCEQTTLLCIHNETNFGFDNNPTVLVTERVPFDFSDDPAVINQEHAFDFIDELAVLLGTNQEHTFDFIDDPAVLLS